MDANGHVLLGGVESVGSHNNPVAQRFIIIPAAVGGKVLETIHLQEIAAGDVALGRQHLVLLCDIHAMRTNIYLIRNLVVAAIGAVDREIHELGSRIELQAGPLSNQSGQGIPDQSLVKLVSQQGPLLCLGIAFAQEFLLGGELDAVGVFAAGVAVSGVSATANLQTVVVGDDVLLIYIIQLCPQLRILACRHFTVVGVDIDVRQIRQTSVLRVINQDFLRADCQCADCQETICK